MLSKLKKSNNEGFTIIEVMIVLAIAGLIILIVLLAVPALQRNGRNAAIKNDASAIAGGVSEYESNNDGAPINGITPVAATPGTWSITGVPGNPTQAKTQGSTTVGVSATPGTAPAATAPTPGKIDVHIGFKCGAAASALSANSRAVAIFYSIENASGTQQKCLDT